MLETLPFPVAHPLAFAHDDSLTPTERLNNTVFAAYQAIRTASLLLLSDYLLIGPSDSALDAAIRGLRMPHWGEWSVLAGRLTEFWTRYTATATEPREAQVHVGHPDRETYFPALLAGWRDVGVERWSESRPGHWHSRLVGRPGLARPARNANDAIWKLRNDRAHRMATHTPDRREEELQLAWALPLVDAMVTALFPPGAFSLVRCLSPDPAAIDPLRIVRLVGPHRDLSFEEEELDPAWRGAFAENRVAALTDNGAISIYPLFAPHDAVPGKAAEHMVLVDGVKPTRIVLLGVRSHDESEGHLGPFTLALARKRVELGFGREDARRWNLAEWSRTLAREEIGQLCGRKYFPQTYLDRHGVDDTAGARLERGGKALLLLGEAGSGKSSLLIRLVDRLVADADAEREPQPKSNRSPRVKNGLDLFLAARGTGDVVLFLSGRAAYAGDVSLSADALLIEAIGRRAGIRSGTFRDLPELCTRLEETSASDSAKDRRVWIVLDAINEADRFVDLMTALDTFLPAVTRHSWLRVVVSCRTGAYASLERRALDRARHGGVFANEHCLFQFTEVSTGKASPYLEVRPFDAKSEGPEAYRLRQAAFPERACAVAFESLDLGLRELLLSPLHLHVFHDTFAGAAEVRGELDEPGLLNAYLDRLGETLPALPQTLANIAQYLLDHATPVLPAAVADGWLADWRAKLGYASADRVAKLDPIEELVSASILMRPANEGFGSNRALVAFAFSHQRLCEQVIARELRRRILPRTRIEPADLAAWAAHAIEHPGFTELRGALRSIVSRTARQADGALIATVLDIEDPTMRNALLEAGLRSAGLAWGQTDEGTTEARAALDGLLEAALGDEVRRDRWIDGPKVGAWLSSRARNYAALALTRARLATLREVGDPKESSRWALEATEAGDRLKDLGRYNEARALYERALVVRQRLVALEPDNTDFARGLAFSCRILGSLSLRMGDIAVARQLCTVGHTISQRLVALQPENAECERLLALSCRSLGDLYAELGEFKAALQFFEDGLAISRRLTVTHPDETYFARDLAALHLRLGDLLLGNFSRTNDPDPVFGFETDAHRLEDLMIPWQIDRRHPGDRSNLGKARVLFEESLRITKRLVAAEPDNAGFARIHVHSLNRLGILSIGSGDVEGAWAYCLSADTLSARLAAAEPGNRTYRFARLVSSDRMGRLSLGHFSRHAVSLEHFGRKLSMSIRRGAEKPTRAEYAREVSSSLTSLGESTAYGDGPREAEKYFLSALAITRRLVAVEDYKPQCLDDLRLTLGRWVECMEAVGVHQEQRRDKSESRRATALSELLRMAISALERGDIVAGLALLDSRLHLNTYA